MADSLAPRAPLRLLIVVSECTGGIRQHVGMLTRGLTDSGASVTLAAPAGTLENLDLDSMVRHISGIRVGLGPARQFASATSQLRAAMTDVDVVHAHGLRASAHAALALPRLTRPAFVSTWHNAPLGGGSRRCVHHALERLVARRADVVLGASPDLVGRARAAGASDARDVFVVAPTTPKPRHTRGEIRADIAALNRPLIVAVGRLHAQKRFDVLIEAVHRWHGDPLGPLTVIAGEGPLRQRLTELIARSGAPVRLLGARSDIADLLAAATLVVVSSDWEARALVAQETLRAGVPLIVTAVGGLPELVGDAALSVPAGDAVALGGAIERVLGDSQLRQRLSAAGPRQAARWPTPEQAIRAASDLYLELTLR